MEEPQLKRKPNVIDCHLNSLRTSKKSLNVVMNDMTSQPLTPVYVGHIKNPRDLSKTVLLLNQKVPVKELQHLKRVRKHEVIICPIEYVNDMSIEDYLCKCDEGFKDIFVAFEVKNVPKLPPKLKKQYEDTKLFWPCNFHPDKYLEKLFSGQFFTEQELDSHRRYMEAAFLAAKWFDVQNVAVVVDPAISSVVAIGEDNRKCHPMQHAAMLAIDNVARTQNGGAWQSQMDDDTFIDVKLVAFLKDLNVKFGHRRFKSKQEEDTGPYLCTGYDVYMMKEPCVMCAMAFVHARARRIFFAIDNEEDGALKSRVKLQTVKSLNHRFEVFTGFL
ncbi:probable inactive tRNA-specific adenosine deaminase-like protein 3 [Pieris brassicae]|uniref:CMP/dCMP-type deaminase domain-containing protein n=1 Tax=Pieris brassicae TaxID=7116 RepID=A0A9P0TZF9_PIEBR|nr:probable inactive tRNA-specific adenosine deaminase-like protein 3 [Pieris brassicae]CAH4039079.1 unnamed protein product [Pieris brassicae]